MESRNRMPNVGIVPASLKLKVWKRANGGKLLYGLKTLKNGRYLLPKKIK